MTLPRFTRVTAGTAARAPERAGTVLALVPDETVRPRRRTRVFTVLAGVAVVAGLFAIVALHVLLSQEQLSLDRLETQAEDLEAQNQRLRVQVAELESPNRVVGEAQRKLGMAPPTTIIQLGGPPNTSAPASRSSAAGDPGSDFATDSGSKPASEPE